MINLTKSQPAPVCLEVEKSKPSSTNYRCGDVVSRCKEDFGNKCYLCEDKNITNINIEHFKPHKGDRDLMFDWNNLFYACGHCNNTKLGGFDDILDCTDNSIKIIDRVKFDIKPFPKEKPKITALNNDTKTINTVNLLEKIYNGTNTSTKIEECANLRERLMK
jgi:uncharacterized protein (TIGR02646 family)